MSGNVVELESHRPQEEQEDVDTSLINTARRTAILGYKIGGLITEKTIGCHFPFLSDQVNESAPRHADLEYDHRITAETAEGSQHYLDIYGIENLYESRQVLSPLLVIMPLSQKHDEGFQAPVIDAVQRHAREQGRAVMVVSSEGFGNKQMPLMQVLKLSFEQMVDNIQDVLDQTEAELGIEIPSILTTGCSRGGTLSLLMGADDRHDRQVEGIISVAPAGLKELDFRKRMKLLKQFLVNEPLHMVRKASSFNGTDLEDYLRTLAKSTTPPRAAGPVGRTGLLFLTDAPLVNIGQRIDKSVPVWVLTMKNDGVATPKYWEKEFQDFPNSRVVSLPGHHVSIDSTRMVAKYVKDHLDTNYASLIDAAL